MDEGNQRPAKRYLLGAGATALVILIAVVVINTVIDPFRMYDFFEIPGLNTYKPAIYQRVRLLKAYEVRRVEPRGIALGNSRVHIAIDPEHRGWDPRSTPRYNLAFDAATTQEMYRYLLHAHATRPLVQVVLGLEYFHLNEGPSATNPDFDQSLLLDPAPGIALPLFVRADLKLLSSMDTLEASVETIRARNNTTPEWFTPNGRRLGEVFFREVDGHFRESGPRAFFDEFMAYETNNKLELIERWQSAVQEKAPPEKIPESESSLGYVMRIVEFCHEHGIDLRIYISPVHANELELTAVLGEYPSIEDGKRLLVRKLDEHASRRPSDPPVPVYDFSGYNSVTTDPLPPPGSREEMKNYWDPSHAKKHVGDFIQDRIFGVSDPGHPVPPDFGIRLDTGNIEEVLARIRSDRAEYGKTHPAEIADIHALVEKIKKERMTSLESSAAAAR